MAVEDPGYQPPRLLFRSHGLQVAGVPVDDEGLVVDALPPDARFVYVTPSRQYPLGMAMSLPRRIALLAWAERHDAAIIEDDYDSEFRYGGRPIEPLHARHERPGHLRRLAVEVHAAHPPAGLRGDAAAAAQGRARGQVRDRLAHAAAGPGALASFIDEGWLARHVRKLRNVYRERHQTLLEGLATELADDLAVIPSAAGCTSALATRLPVDQVEQVALHAEADGVGVQRLSWFRVEHPPLAGLALGYGIAADRIGEGLRRLRRAFDRVNAGAG